MKVMVSLQCWAFIILLVAAIFLSCNGTILLLHYAEDYVISDYVISNTVPIWCALSIGMIMLVIFAWKAKTLRED